MWAKEAAPLKVVFSRNPARFSFTNLPVRAHTSSHIFKHHPATVRLAGRKQHARFESSDEAVGGLPSVVRTAVGLHAAWLLRQDVASLQQRSSAYILMA